MCKPINKIQHINSNKGKNHKIISTDVEKAFDKIQYPFMIKAPPKLGMEGSNVNIITTICHTLWLTLHGMVKNLKIFPWAFIYNTVILYSV
jgi:hypothetical protein